MHDRLFPTDKEVETPTPVAEKTRSRRVYPQWDALVYLFGEPRTPSNKRLFGKIAAELREAGYGKDEIMLAARLYRAEYQGISFTATALLKHIDQLMHEHGYELRKLERAQNPMRLVVLPDLEAM